MDNIPQIEIENTGVEVIINDAIDLRDHFAGLAMQGILSSMSQLRYNGFGYSAEELASESYAVADAMLKALKEVKP